MNGKVFFDTNVLIYAAGADPRAVAAQAVLAKGGSISVQVLNEFAHTAHRKLRRSWPEIASALAVLRVLCLECVPIIERTHEEARGIAQRNGTSFYDSLIIASALQANCSTLYSGDMQDGLVFEERLAIRNPFQ